MKNVLIILSILISSNVVGQQTNWKSNCSTVSNKTAFVQCLSIESEKADSILTDLYIQIEKRTNVHQKRLDEYDDNIVNVEEKYFGNFEQWCKQWADYRETISNTNMMLVEGGTAMPIYYLGTYIEETYNRIRYIRTLVEDLND